jgi:ABC-type nitrate/sulfonate/bicarbonate transport system substrate-binding protein
MKSTLLRAACASAVLLACATQASAADKVNFIIFQSASALASYVADDHGIFAKHGLDVAIKPTPNSGYMMTNLIDGKYDIASSAFDNFIAYNQGQTKNKGKYTAKSDLVVFLGVTTQNLPVIVSPDIKTIADLKGKPVGVDAKDTAFAFVIYKILEKNGLGMSDYEIKAVGGTTKRWEAMQKGAVKAAIISGAYAAAAREKGFKRLADSQGTLGVYQGSSLGAQRGWLQKNRAVAVRFVRAHMEGMRWAANPANHAAAAASLRKRIKGMSEKAALGTVRRVTTGKPGGLTLDGSINQDGLQQVIALREQYGTPKMKVADPNSFIDMSILADAMKK